MAPDPEKDLLSTRKKRDISFFDLYSIDQITTNDLNLIFEIARKFREYKTYKFSLCKGRSQINAFFEASTRTMVSFDLSAKQLSMDTTGVGGNSSIKKGESYLDTAQTLDAYNVATIVVRSSESGVPEMLARHVGASVINAGDGWHEHPTQALLDVLTMLDHFNKLSTTASSIKNIKGKTVTIVGDIMHSRVYGSLVRILKKLGATVRVVSPATMVPRHTENFGVKLFYNIEDALTEADVVYALRVQEERGANGYIPSLREYSKMFGISRKRLDLANKNAILMHPGPVVRDIDVHSALSAVDSQSHILKQVENGTAIRKALLWLMANREDGETKTYLRI